MSSLYCRVEVQISSAESMVRSTGTVNSKGLQSTCVNDMRASMPMLCFGAGNGMGAVASDVKLASLSTRSHWLQRTSWICHSWMDATMHVTTTYTNTAVSIGTTIRYARTLVSILDTIDLLPWSLQHLAFNLFATAIFNRRLS